MKEDILISINNISKNYSGKQIYSDFSYEFEKTGLYLLYGKSGCGKTTLLNILFGTESYEQGYIIFNGEKYENKVSSSVENICSYITQDTYLIEYLSIMDNLLLSSDETVENIRKILSFLHLENKINEFPNKLSGGEIQRVAIAQALLNKKKILLLDEPTSSLDENNKKNILEVLNMLKEKVLIICSTHDSQMKCYCDYIVDYNKLIDYSKKNDQKLYSKIYKDKNKNKSKNLYYYIRKQQKFYKNKNKTLLILSFTLSILMLLICNRPMNKLLDTISNKYKVNYLTVYCNYENNICGDFFKKIKAKEYDYVYSLNLPNDNSNYLNDVITVPSNVDYYPFENKIKYGKYPQSEKEILLGYDMALKYNSKSLKDLIGTDIYLNVPNGPKRFIISGILDKMDEVMTEYYVSGRENRNFIDENYFFTGLYTEKLKDDSLIGYNEETIGKSVYYVFFDDFNELYKVYSEYSGGRISDNIYIKSFENQYLELIELFNKISLLFYPTIVIIMISSLIIYYHNVSTELYYKKENIAIYNYYGYDFKSIKQSLIKYNISIIIKCLLISIFVSLILSFIINFINLKFSILSFSIFNYDIFSFVIFSLLLITLSYFLSARMCNIIRKKGWYYISKESTDLL